MSLTLRHEAPADRRAAETLVREAFGTSTSPAATSTTISICSVSPRLPPGADLRMRGGRRPGRADRLRLQLHRAGGRRVSGHRHLRSPGRPPSFQGKGLARALVCHALRQAQALGEQAVVILGDPRHYGRYGFWCGERWGISLENGQYLPGLQAVELAPGSLANAAGRFREGFAYAPDAAALDAFDALFLVKEKAITDFQQEFQVMCSLGHEVIPNGFMQ